MEIVKAINLRNKDNLLQISNNKPGWYRWWALDKEVKSLLNSMYIDNEYYKELINLLTSKVIDGNKYYYIYVGIAVKESIRSRLDWHVNQKHSKSSVESGFLSTLRQTLSSLVAGDQYNEVNTNKFIDNLIIEYYEIDEEIKSINAKEIIENIEKEELNNNVLILNIKDNKNDNVREFLKELKKVRKNSK